MKIKTLVLEWNAMLYCTGSHDGPEIEFDESEVRAGHASSRPCSDEQILLYLYFKTNRPTVCVRYTALLAVSPSLAKQAMDEYLNVISGPDPDMGSAS